MVIAFVGLVLWERSHDRALNERSRAIRIGMDIKDIRPVMGIDANNSVRMYGFGDGSRWMVFGPMTSWRESLRFRVRYWLEPVTGTKTLPEITPLEEWPVRVHMNELGFVDRIVRGNEVEEDPERSRRLTRLCIRDFLLQLRPTPKAMSELHYEIVATGADAADIRLLHTHPEGMKWTLQGELSRYDSMRRYLQKAASRYASLVRQENPDWKRTEVVLQEIDRVWHETETIEAE